MSSVGRNILAFLLCLGLSSCVHKELCYDHSHICEVDVVFDWTGVSQEDIPATMSLYLFPRDGGRLRRFEFADFRGGRVRLEGGYYDAVCVNSGVREVEVLYSEGFYDFAIRSKSAYRLAGLSDVSTKAIPRAKGTEEERVTSAPEIVWTAVETEADLRTTGSALLMKPLKKARRIFVEIRNAENLRWINGVSATLSTMSGGYLPSQDRLSEENVTIMFNCAYSIDEEKILGSLTTFGHCSEESSKHLLTLYVILADNSKWFYIFDVTDQVHESGEGDIRIILDKLPIPQPATEGGGLKPEVMEWKEITFDIKM